MREVLTMDRAMASWSAVRMGSRADDGLAGGSVGRSAREERIGCICFGEGMLEIAKSVR